MRLGGKRSKPASTGVWVVKRFPALVAVSATWKGYSVVLHEVTRAFQDGQSGVAFVEVADLRRDAQRPEHPPAGDAQDHLLLQAHLRAAAVELAGDAAVGRAVGGVVGVEQVELHPPGLHLPHAQPDRRAGGARG